MTTITRLLAPLALALLFGSGRAAGAQTTPADGVDAQGSSDTIGDPALRREIETARAKGVPVGPLLTKVREGRLKRASAPRIRVAVAALAVRLDSARAIIGADATVEELTACSDALAVGASAEELRFVAAAASVRPMSAPLGALAQLVASGVPPKRAAAMIVELLRKKVGGPQVLAFGNLVEADAASGVPAEEAAAFRLHSIGAGGTTALTTMMPSTTLNSMAKPQQKPPTTAPRRRP